MSLVVAATLLLSPAAAQARFAGLMVCHDDRDIFLVGLDSIFGGYYYADFLLACLEPCSERTRTFRAGKRRRPPLLENHNRPRLYRLWLGITGLSRVASSTPLVCNQLKMRTSGYTDVEGREEVGVARLTPTVLTDCDHSLNWGITGHRDPPRRSSDCDGACLSGFLGDIDPICLMWTEPISLAR